MSDLFQHLFDDAGQIKNEHVEDLMIEVTSGRSVFEYGGDLFATRQPNLSEQDRGRIIYRRTIQRAKLDGCMPRASMEELSIEREYVDADKREEKNNHLELIRRFSSLREQSTDPDQKLKIDSDIATSRQRLEEVEIDEYEIFQHTMEEKGERARQFYFVSCCTLGGLMLDVPVWSDYESFKQSHQTRFILSARRALARVSRGLPIKVIRALARSHEWRARWKASKESGTQPFDGSSASWDRNKVGLIYWSDFYDSVYAHPECPVDETVSNDEALQVWINQQVAKKKLGNRNSGSGNGGRPVTYIAGGQRKVMTKTGETRIAVNTPVRVRTGNE